MTAGCGLFQFFTEGELKQNWLEMRDDARLWPILLFREGFFPSRGRTTVLLLGHDRGVLCG